MTKWRQRLCIYTTIVIVGLAWSNASQCKDADQGFYATVREQFSQWDLNHDGILTAAEINRAFQNPKYRGRAAAAIAALQKIETKHLGHQEALESFTLSQINDMESSAKPGHDKNKSNFRSCLKKINAASPQLFANGLPKMDEIHQGSANDCYFLAVVASLALERPRQLARLIEPNDNGSFTVHFFGKPPVIVTCPTSGEISAYNSNGKDGIWLPVMVKAFGELKLAQDGSDYTEDPVERAVIHGGNTGTVVKLLTGNAVIHYKPRAIAHDLRRKLMAAYDQHRLVLIAVPGHAMTAVAYDRQSDQLTIWNPWGSSHIYKRFGIKMEHGFFSIPISEVIDKCTHISFEVTKRR